MKHQLLITALCLGQLMLTEAYLQRQRYDGWFNNLANPAWGSIGSDVTYEAPPSFSDLTYNLAGSRRPSARYVSNQVHSGPSGLPSYTNRTLIFVFFGQLAAMDLVRTSEPSCPVELVKVPIPENDTEFRMGDDQQNTMPFMRSMYNRASGNSPNNPRRPVNHVTSWLDANWLYGGGEVWANCLRSFTGGQLLTRNSTPGYPGLNKIGLPLDTFPSPIDHKLPSPYKMWMFGARNGHQTPPLTSLLIVWFRYHNYLAKKISEKHPDWKDAVIYQTARRRLIATWQNILFYEWLPELLGESLPQYSGHKSHVQPGVSALFEAAAFRFGHSMVPPGIYLRDNKCNFKQPDNATALRLCNCYWRSQELIEKYGVERFVMGMASQVAEREDQILVSDMRGKTFGPLHYSRQDIAVLNIMRGRDHGLPDYNKARKALGLDQVTRWEDINPWLASNKPEEIERLRKSYGDNLNDLDVFPAGLLEFTPSGPGPLFHRVIRDQFVRLRDADRYWFENSDNGMFNDEEMSEIKKTTFYDVITAVTDIEADSIQKDVFHYRQGDPCPQPKQLESADLEECTPPTSFDYFSGSEIPYIIGFTSLGVFPLVVIAFAYTIYKIKNTQWYKRFVRWKNKSLPDSKGSLKAGLGEGNRDANADTFTQALEWTGKKQPQSDVRLVLESNNFSLHVKAARKKRTINFNRMSDIDIWLNEDRKRNMLMISVPKGIDLVVLFPSEDARSLFVTQLKEMLRPHPGSLTTHICTEQYVHSRAVTKERRQELLTKFFRNVFAEAYKLDDIRLEEGIEADDCKDIAECELTREEFAEALAMTPDSSFVSQMFSLIDKDLKGYISFRDMIYTVALFTNGSVDDKIHLLFMMYDLDKTGKLSRTDVITLIRSMVEMASTELAKEDVESLLDNLLNAAGLEGVEDLDYDQFRTVLEPYMGALNNMSLHWKGANEKPSHKKEKEKPPARERSASRSRLGSITSIASRSRIGSITSIASNISLPLRKMSRVHIIPMKQPYSKMRLRMKNFQQYIENNRQHIVYTFLFFCICTILYVERFYTYSFELEHAGYRSLTSYGIGVTRGAAAVMSFTFSLLLLTMCRNVMTWLRQTILNLYIPFDSHVQFHKLVAYTALFFTVIHILGYCFNFYMLATQPLQFLCVFQEVYFRSDYRPTFKWWLFENVTGATGYILVLVICIIYIFASQTARRYIFSAFWLSHQLYYALYLLTLLHGSAKVVQEPYFPYYFMGPAIAFCIDKIVSLSRKKKKLDIIKAELLPSNVTLLEFKRPANFEYRSGQWVRMACLDLGENEYHPFTLTSSPDEDTLRVHIRAIGPWSTNIRNLVNQSVSKEKPFPQLYVDGPFGAGQQDWYRYDVSVLVGGGIGVTPYASILKDYVFMSNNNNRFKIKCKKLYFIWVTGSQRQWEWFIDILRQAEESDTLETIEGHIFITQFFQKFDLRTTMLYICEEQFTQMTNRSMFTGLRAKTHFGRPNFTDILTEIGRKHHKVKRFGVFSCGPPGLTKGLEKACHTNKPSIKATFHHHFENF